jgi:hypothetical protein
VAEETVTISRKRLDELEEAEREMTELRIQGVDNWDGFGEAMRRAHEGD